MNTPSFTLGSALTSVFQFMAIMAIMGIMLNTKTTNGYGLLPENVLIHSAGLINVLNTTYINTTNPNSLTVQLTGQLYNSSNSINVGGLTQLGGLAFIPAAFGLFMQSIFQIPNTILLLFQTLFTLQGAYVVLPFSIMAISGIFMAYMVIEFVMKAFTPISKTEISDI